MLTNWGSARVVCGGAKSMSRAELSQARANLGSACGACSVWGPLERSTYLAMIIRISFISYAEYC